MSTTRLHRLTGMDLDFVSLVAAGDDPMAQVVIAKAAPVDVSDNKSGEASGSGRTLSPSSPSMEETMGTIEKTGLDPAVLDFIDGLEVEVETLSAQVAKSESDIAAKDTEIADLRGTLAKSAPKDDEAAEEINKALLSKADPALRSLIEKQQADLKATQEIAKAERNERLTRESIAKAESMPNVPGEPTDLASLFRRLADALTPEDAATVEKTFRAMDAQVAASGIFKSLGHGGGETTLSKSVEAKAAEIQKADPTLTHEQAMVKVYESDPDLASKIESGEDA